MADWKTFFTQTRLCFKVPLKQIKQAKRKMRIHAERAIEALISPPTESPEQELLKAQSSCAHEDDYGTLELDGQCMVCFKELVSSTAN